MDNRYAVLLITLPTFLRSDGGLPTLTPRSTPRCVQQFSNNIQRYWVHNPPVDNISYPLINWQLYTSRILKFVAGTKSPENSPYTCRRLRFRPARLWNGVAATMEFENDGVEEKIQVREKDGYLRLLDYVFVYNVITIDGVYAAYKCTTDGYGPVEPAEESRSPEAFVAATDKATSTDINNALGVMELIGFQLDHKFNCSNAEK